MGRFGTGNRVQLGYLAAFLARRISIPRAAREGLRGASHLPLAGMQRVGVIVVERRAVPVRARQRQTCASFYHTRSFLPVCPLPMPFINAAKVAA